jgi:membrane-associated protease RseP (regulator of RpoE activity)
MSVKLFRNAMSFALISALTLGAGTLALANSDDQSDGVVKIGKSDKDDSASPQVVRSVGPQAELPKYWIGLLGGAIPQESPLRAHLDLPENQGLIIANVMPDSPAAKAGLKQHDIMLRANDKDLHEMQDLVELVLSEGPKKGQITLDVLRHNKRETVYLTAEERPANAQLPQVDFNNGAGVGGGEFGLPPNFLQQFGGNMPLEFRNFGNGVIVGGGEGVGNMPNGVSVSVQKEEGKPANITVKRGDETWNVVGDDPESLKQLPEDIRPFVERMIHGNGVGAIQMPNFEHRMGGPGFDNGGLRDRLERMEQRLEELQKRLGNAPADKSNDANNK